MTDETWLRDALSRATARQPAGGDRVGRAFALVARRRRQRLVAASCTAVAGVFVATALTAGGTTTAGLEPVAPASSATATRSTAPRPGGPGTGRQPGLGPLAPRTPSVPYVVGRDGTGGGGNSGTAGRRPALDVYFLVDATSGMSGHQAEVRRAVDQITTRLAAKTSLRHGFALFQDIPSRAPLTVVDTVYEQLSPVTADGGRMPDFTAGGGGEPPEGHSFALDAAIGVAHEPWTVDPEPAGFAPGARKLVVIVTDGPINTDSTHPAPGDVVRRLNAAGVAVASLIVVGRDYEVSTRDMRWLALKTGATARRSADCNGDGVRDLRRGGPLLCEVVDDRGYRYTGFADAILARWF